MILKRRKISDKHHFVEEALTSVSARDRIPPTPVKPSFYLHEFGVMSGVDHNAMNPLRVPQLGTSQQNLVWT